MTHLEKILASDHLKYPANALVTVEALLHAIGRRPAGYMIQKKNRKQAHSPENSFWVPSAEQKMREYRAEVQRLVARKL